MSPTTVSPTSENPTSENPTGENPTREPMAGGNQTPAGPAARRLPSEVRRRIVRILILGTVAIVATIAGAVALSLGGSIAPEPARPTSGIGTGAPVPTSSTPGRAPETIVTPVGDTTPGRRTLPDGRSVTAPRTDLDHTDLSHTDLSHTVVAGDVAVRGTYTPIAGSTTCRSYDDGDGTPEWTGCDDDRDGFAESQFWDSDENGVAEWVRAPAGGVAGGMVLAHDADQNGRIEHLQFDTDGNGRTEAQAYDENQDGVMDWYGLDRFHTDGWADTWVRTGSPEAQQANDQRAVEHIVTMDALQSLCRSQGLC